MSDIELTQREKEILSLELSKASQNATGGFFSSRDEIQHNLESHFSDEISSDRIDEICNEIIDDLYSFGGDVQYDSVRDHLQEFDVHLEEPNPVDFGVSPKSSGAQKSDQKVDADTVNGKANEASASDNPEPSENGSSDEKRKHVNDFREIYDESTKKKDEKDRKREIEDKAEESYQKSQELIQRAADIRRSMSEKAFMNPYALMGYTAAKMSIIAGNITRNILTSRIPGLGWSLSGKSILGKSLGYNMKADKHKGNWGKDFPREHGSKDFIKNLENANNLLSDADPSTPDKYMNAQKEMGQGLKAMKKKGFKISESDKPMVDDLMKSISEKLKGNGQDNEAIKKMKEQMKKMNAEIMKFIKKLFGLGKSNDQSSPEPSGP